MPMPASTSSRRHRARRGQGEALRGEILAAARELLAETGNQEAVSVRAVAERVGITTPSIYLHFKDKDDLLDAVCADVFGAFGTADFTKQGTTPRNVALLCQWTWACAAPPRGPNQHANQAGYQVIARAFMQASGLS